MTRAIALRGSHHTVILFYSELRERFGDARSCHDWIFLAGVRKKRSIKNSVLDETSLIIIDCPYDVFDVVIDDGSSAYMLEVCLDGGWVTQYSLMRASCPTVDDAAALRTKGEWLLRAFISASDDSLIPMGDNLRNPAECYLRARFLVKGPEHQLND